MQTVIRPRSNLIDFNLKEENFHHVFTHLVLVVRRGNAAVFPPHVHIDEKMQCGSDKTVALMLIAVARGHCLQTVAASFQRRFKLSSLLLRRRVCGLVIAKAN